tara:strand:- start:45 stop:647 length:603 start_codon:yes stop_codon:yes gene_type:complete
MSDNVTLFEKNQDNTIFRLAIYGTNDKARELYDNFDSSVTNVQMFDSIDELIQFQPHNVFMTKEDTSVMSHKVLQDLNVSVAVFAEMTIDQWNILLIDYQYRNAPSKLVYCKNIGSVQIWGGSNVGLENLSKLYDSFAKTIPVVHVCNHLEIFILEELSHKFQSYLTTWKQDIKEKSEKKGVSANKMIRLATAVAFSNEM